MKGMILAAGFGTRFRPITYTLPKPMVPLCNKPLIGWAVESYLDAGVHEIVVNLHHLPEIIERHLRARYDAQFHFSREEEILGTGGGIRRVRGLLEGDDEFFLINGDTVQFPQYDALHDARHAHTAVAALTLRHPPEGDRFTAVWYEKGLVTGFGTGTGEPLMFSGSHCLSSRIFQYLPEQEFSKIVEHAYQPLLENHTEWIAGIVDDGLWFDIGTPKRYLAAMTTLIGGADLWSAGRTGRPPSIVDASARVNGTITRSTVGARSDVRGTLRDTAVWEDCAIGERAVLERCIVAHGVEIAGAVELRDMLICRDDPAIPPEFERREGLVIVPCV
ncbi:MAG TPA: sugar phosphate nucleotidyltransferase [Thermoanaerobaculia bacterium]|nr:sugar phosphate nucleotidyltransferase [Thermoanaerobaculia bacterium]